MEKGFKITKIDFCSDFIEYLKQQLAIKGSILDKEIAKKDICGLFFNLKKRLVESKPRHVYESRELICPAEYEEGFKLIKNNIEKGVDLKPHLSRLVKKLEEKDLLLFDWDIYHLHLGIELEPNGFYKRTKPVLFVRFDAENAYLIKIAEHGNWTMQELIKIIYRNWPESIEQYRLRGIDSSEIQFSDDTLADFRAAGVIAPIDMGDGNIYGLIGGGYATSKDSITVTRTCDYLKRVVENWEKKIEKEYPKIVDSIIKQGVKMKPNLEFKLVISNDAVNAKETNSDIIFPLQNFPDYNEFISLVKI